MKYFFKLILVLVAFSSCTDSEDATNLNAKRIIQLNKADVAELTFSSVFKNVTAFPLLGNLNGAKSVNKVVIDENNIYVLDKEAAKGVFIYDNTGHFLSQLGRIGKGPGEYLDISDFDVFEDKVAISEYPDQIMLFDKKGNFRKKQRLDFDFTSFISTNNGYLFFNNYQSTSGNNDYFNVIETGEDFDFSRGFFPYDKSLYRSNLVAYPSNFVRTHDQKILFSSPLTNATYQFDGESFEKLILLDFGDNPLPVDLFDSQIKPEKLMDIFEKGHSFQLHPFYSAQKHSFFKISIDGGVKYFLETKNKRWLFSQYLDDILGVPYYSFLGIHDNKLVATINWSLVAQSLNNPESNYHSRSPEVKKKFRDFLKKNQLDPETAEPTIVLFEFK